MKKNFLIGLFLFLSFCSRTFACGAKGTTSLATSNNQKACKNVVSFIFIDFSFLSPRAAAADVSVGMPKHCMHWMNKCCTPQCCIDEGCPPQCGITQTCPQKCPPQCCPCAPKCPDCKTKSMAPDENKEEAMATDTELRSKHNLPFDVGLENPTYFSNQKQALNVTRYNIKKDELIPVAYKQETQQQNVSPKNKPSLFRIDLFRRFKFQIL